MSSLADGRTIAITGANGGIGRYTALQLARDGARVVLICRTPERAEDAKAFVLSGCPGARVSTGSADLSILADVRRLAQRVAAEHPDVSILVNNAGLISSHRIVTRDGFELTFAVNHLAPFALSMLLLSALRRNAPARIVNVNSDAHLSETLDLDDLQSTRRYWPPAVYGRSKLANMLFTTEFARRVDPSSVSMNGLHPGLVATDFGDVGGIVGFGWRFAKLGGITPQEGATTPVYVVTSSDLSGKSGGFYRKSRQVDANPLALDEALARRLWEYSEEATGVNGPGRR